MTNLKSAAWMFNSDNESNIVTIEEDDISDLTNQHMIPEEPTMFDAELEDIFRSECRQWLASNAAMLFNETNTSWKLNKTTPKPRLKRSDATLGNMPY